ncbi:hypothetical protein Ndes2526A_g05546 [Nannochloris sp. 'desiccata']
MAEEITPPADMGQLSVLVIDPRSSSRAATTKLLEESGYKVLAVPTGSKAFALLSQPREAGGSPIVDAVLKAHDPPVSNGPRFLQKFMEIEHTKELPVIGE